MKQLKFGFVLVFLFSFYLFFDEVTAEAAVVNPNQVYTYEKMEKDIINLEKMYPDLITYKVIGKSEYGRNIYAVSLGKGQANIFINGSHHAREWMTTSLNMYMIDQYASSYISGGTINGYNTGNLLDKTTIWFVPMVNPDGVTLQQFGLKAFPASAHNGLIKMNAGSKDFTRWKANGKGVDLNRQYDAYWATIVSDPGKPYYKNYKGTKPQSSSEVQAIVNFVNEIDPRASVSYHSSGEILYWNFRQTGSWYDRDHSYAKQIGKMTGYSLVYPGPNPSGGGFTDWFIINYKRPGFTPEISRYYRETSPPISEFSRVWSQNKAVGLYVANIGYDLYQKEIASVIKGVEKKVNDAINKSNNLRFYYSGRVNTEKDLVVDSSFTNAYQAANKSIKSAESAIKTLPKNDADRLTQTLQAAYAHKDKAAIFIDTLKTVDILEGKSNELQTIVMKGQLDDQTVTAYHNLSSQLKKSGIFIGKMYNPTVRNLTSAKYVLPAQILKENIIYEISRYMLIKEIEAIIAPENIDLIESKLAELSRLEKRSVEIKKAGNELYPGRYPDLPQFEEILTEKKEALLEAYNAIKPTEEIPTETPSQPDSAQNQTGQAAEEATVQGLQQELAAPVQELQQDLGSFITQDETSETIVTSDKTIGNEIQ